MTGFKQTKQKMKWNKWSIDSFNFPSVYRTSSQNWRKMPTNSPDFQ